jgi:hypothetical protein
MSLGRRRKSAANCCISDLPSAGRYKTRGERSEPPANSPVVYFALENWYPSLPAEYAAEQPLKVYYDMGIARDYIGPVHESQSEEK